MAGIRLAVLADVHGNLPALEAALDDVTRQGVDRIICLGDLADRGPYPHECVERVRAACHVTIAGDNDLDVLAMANGQAPKGWQESLQFAPLRWTAAHMNGTDLFFLASLPQQYRLDTGDEPPVRFVHGSPRSPAEPVFEDRDLSAADALGMVHEDVLVAGHTHQPWLVRVGNRVAFNPGSVGQPFNDDPRAQYALLISHRGKWGVEHRAVPYDVERVREAFVTSGYLAAGGALARACLLTDVTGSNHIMPFLWHAYRLAAERGCDGCRVVPDEVWREAATSWDWDGIAYRGNHEPHDCHQHGQRDAERRAKRQPDR